MSAQTLLMSAVQNQNPEAMLNALDMGANPYMGHSDSPSALETLASSPQFIRTLASPYQDGAQSQAVVNKMLSAIPANHQEVVSIHRSAAHVYRALASQRAITHTLTERAQAQGMELTAAAQQQLNTPTQALAFFLGSIERSTGWKLYRQEQGELQTQQWVRQVQQHGAQEGSTYAQSIDLNSIAQPSAAPQVGFDAAHSNNHQKSMERAPSLADGPTPLNYSIPAPPSELAPAPTAVYESDRQALSHLQSLSARPQSVVAPRPIEDEISADKWNHLVPKLGASRIQAHRQSRPQEPSRAPELS